MSGDTRSAEAAANAPDESHEEKPDSPDDLTKRSWLFVARKTLREFSKDQCTDIAAALTYFAVLAMFPAVVALLSLIGLTGNSQQTIDTVLGIVRSVAGESVAGTISPILDQLAGASGAGVALVVGIAAALWSASGYTSAFGRAMNRMYEIDEGRPFWKFRPAMIAVTAVLVSMAAVVLVGLVVSGPAAEAVGDAIGLGSTAVIVWSIAKWPVILVVVVLMVALLYWATPNLQQPKFRWISVGAVLAIVVWIIASAAFGFYVANFASYNKTYGSLAGVVIFLLWLWLTNLALLFGAELDAELERGRELQAGIKAEKHIQLPPRDTTKIEKDEQKEQEDIEKGREIRLANSPGSDQSDSGSERASVRSGKASDDA